MFLAQGLHKFLVRSFVAVLGQDAEQSLSLVESFGGFTKSTRKSVLDKSGLENLTESGFEIHAASEVFGGSTSSGCGSSSGHRLISFDVRHDFLLAVSCLINCRNPR